MKKEAKAKGVILLTWGSIGV